LLGLQEGSQVKTMFAPFENFCWAPAHAKAHAHGEVHWTKQQPLPLR